MATVVVLCLLAVFSGDMDYSRPVENFQPATLKMGTAAALVFVAFGAIKVGAIGGEVIDPETNLSRGMMQLLFIATFFIATVSLHHGRRHELADFMTDGHAVENPITVFAESVAAPQWCCGVIGGHHRHGVHGAGGRVVSLGSADAMAQRRGPAGPARRTQ